MDLVLLIVLTVDMIIVSKQQLKKLWEKERGREIAAQHDLIRGLTLAERRAARMRLSLAERLAAALTQARTLSDGFAGSYDRSGAPQPPSSKAPRPVESIHDRYERRFALMIRNLEDEIDYAKLRPVGHRERSEDRIKRLLRDYEGFSADEVAFIDPSMGSVLSIRRERNAAGRDYLGRSKSEYQ